MGMSPQTGLPQNNRVGDLDPFCLPMLMQHTGMNLEEMLKALSTQAGLLGLSGGVSGDIRDLESAASSGNADAQLALDVYVAEIRRQLGSMLVALGGLDALVSPVELVKTERRFALLFARVSATSALLSMKTRTSH